VLELGSRGDPPRPLPDAGRSRTGKRQAGQAPGGAVCAEQSFSASARPIAILLLAAGNSGQAGLSQGQIPLVRTLGLYGVTSVVFSPDGRYLAVGTAGGSSVQLIDTSRWQVIRTFEGHTDDVRSVAFSPDGRLLASGSGDETIKLWDISDLVGR
jgi:WD40 repeat protein